MRDDGTAVVQHIREHAGDTLQAVIIYDEDAHRDLYRRKDVESLHGSPLEETVLEWFRSEARGSTSAKPAVPDGQLRASVRLLEHRVVLHLPRDPESGTIIVLDVPAAQQLASFVADLRADLYGGTET